MEAKPMTLPNTHPSLTAHFRALGVSPGANVMVHSSLGAIGWTIGGPQTVITALFDCIESTGTLVMPAETPQISDPSEWDDERVLPEWHATIREHLPVFDSATTPTMMGAIAEAFRTSPGTLRSDHPQVSVCANGPNASGIVVEHEEEFCEGRNTPFEKLYDLDAWTLLLGVGFDRCTSLHYAESLTVNRRTTLSRYPVIESGNRVWVEKPNMAADNGRYFPAVGEEFLATGAVTSGRVGEASALFFSTRALVDFAVPWFSRELAGDAS